MGNIKISTKAVSISQRPERYKKSDEFLNEYDFFVFSLSSSVLLEIAKFTSRSDADIGVQRDHKEERDRQIGKFICSENPFFPNTIIINIPIPFNDEYFNKNNNLLEIEIPKKSAYIIDGQHRLKAFSSRYSEETELEMVVAAYFDLELPTIAEIFTRINYFQKPVSKSLVYDLLDLNKDHEFQKYKEGHEIISRLNSKIGSPFYDMIKLLGVGKGLISQAAAVEAFTTRYKILEILDKEYHVNDKANIIERYFQAVEKAFPGKWANKDSIISRSVGFNALVKVLNYILSQKDKFYSHNEINFEDITKRMSSVDVDSEDLKNYGGFKGVNTLSAMFISAIEGR